MAVFVDPDRLLHGLARTLRQRVVPGISDDSARFSAQMAIEMLVNLKHRREGRVPPPDAAAVAAMADEVRGLTESAVNAAGAGRLVGLLREDSRFYREDKDRHHALLDAENATREEVFEAPGDAALTALLRRWSGDPAVEGRLVGRAVGGYSKQTLFVDMMRGDVVERQLVMRRDLPFATADRSSVAIEQPVLKALFDRGYTVAEPLLLEADPSVLGTPFLISQRVHGRLYGNSLGLREPVTFDPEAMLGKLLADLHAVDVAGLDLESLPGSATDLTSQQSRIDHWTAVYRAHVETPSAALEIGLAWLRANAHLVSGRSAIVHGDVGFHNILIDEGRAVALVDWELVHLANPAEDLAYVSSYIARPEALIEEYVRHGGARPSEGEMTYCRVFGDVRNSIYGTVSMAQFNRGDHDDVSVLPIVLNSYWSYVAKLERALDEAITTHGFCWQES